ncbi:MAG: RdgB/HAM1 family non-canonical purine NTP pyrophosphatase [Alphaproteobacteria bacterium]|nr:RdgB/HAM1 family non-canonical purine NTP pyrophosphatase [Alphaproteobacteria bacterium]
MKELLLATHNAGKIREFRELLAPLGIATQSAVEHNLPEPEETGTTFEENALLKVRTAMEATGLPALADDSGLCVEELGGAPGIYSARWAEKEDGSRDFNYAMQRIYDELGGIDGIQKAAFVAVLALSYSDGQEKLFEGRMNGHLCWPARGDKGFGYDPIFVPVGHDLTFAEMELVQKQAISHRAKAVEKLIQYLSQNA